MPLEAYHLNSHQGMLLPLTLISACRVQVSEAVASELQGEEAARCRQALTPLGKRKAAAGKHVWLTSTADDQLPSIERLLPQSQVKDHTHTHTHTQRACIGAGEELYAQALLSEGNISGQGLTEQQQHQLAR